MKKIFTPILSITLLICSLFYTEQSYSADHEKIQDGALGKPLSEEKESEPPKERLINFIADRVVELSSIKHQIFLNVKGRMVTIPPADFVPKKKLSFIVVECAHVDGEILQTHTEDDIRNLAKEFLKNPALKSHDLTSMMREIIVQLRTEKKYLSLVKSLNAAKCDEYKMRLPSDASRAELIEESRQRLFRLLKDDLQDPLNHSESPFRLALFEYFDSTNTVHLEYMSEYCRTLFLVAMDQATICLEHSSQFRGLIDWVREISESGNIKEKESSVPRLPLQHHGRSEVRERLSVIAQSLHEKLEKRKASKDVPAPESEMKVPTMSGELDTSSKPSATKKRRHNRHKKSANPAESLASPMPSPPTGEDDKGAGCTDIPSELRDVKAILDEARKSLSEAERMRKLELADHAEEMKRMQDRLSSADSLKQRLLSDNKDLKSQSKELQKQLEELGSDKRRLEKVIETKVQEMTRLTAEKAKLTQDVKDQKQTETAKASEFELLDTKLEFLTMQAQTLAREKAHLVREVKKHQDENERLSKLLADKTKEFEALGEQKKSEYLAQATKHALELTHKEAEIVKLTAANSELREELAASKDKVGNLEQTIASLQADAESKAAVFLNLSSALEQARMVSHEWQQIAFQFQQGQRSAQTWVLNDADGTPITLTYDQVMQLAGQRLQTQKRHY